MPEYPHKQWNAIPVHSEENLMTWEGERKNIENNKTNETFERN